MIGLAAALCLSSLPVHGQERREACEQQGETVVVYDCQTGLVLWSKAFSKTDPPGPASDRELCRLVVGTKPLLKAAEQCL